MTKKTLLFSFALFALVGVFVTVQQAEASRVQMNFNVKNVGIGVGDSVSATLLKPTGNDWNSYANLGFKNDFGDLTCKNWQYYPSSLPLPEENCASVLGLDNHFFDNFRVQRLDKNGNVIAGTSGNGVVITPHINPANNGSNYYEVSISSYGGTTRFEVHPIPVNIVNPNCTPPACMLTVVKGVRIKLLERNPNDLSSLSGTYAYKFIFPNYGYMWKAQGVGTIVGRRAFQDFDPSIIVRINEFHTNPSYVCVTAGSSFDVSMLYDGVPKNSFWPTGSTVNGSNRKWTNGYFSATAPETVVTEGNYVGSEEKVRFTTPSFSSGIRTGVMNIGYNPMGDWTFGYDLFSSNFNLTVVPIGSSCGTMTINGPDVIELQEGQVASYNYSTNIGTENTKWSANWDGHGSFPGVNITSPKPRAQFLGGPNCRNGDPNLINNNLSLNSANGKWFFTFIHGFFDGMFSLVKQVYAADNCWIYHDPVDLTMNLSVNASGVSHLSGTVEKKLYLYAYDKWGAVKEIIVRIHPIPSQSITISGDNSIHVVAGTTNESHTYTASGVSAVMWQNPPEIISGDLSGVTFRVVSNNSLSPKLRVVALSNTAGRSGVIRLVALDDDGPPVAEPGTMDVSVAIDSSTSTGPNFNLTAVPPPPEIVITRPTSGTVASTTLIFINGFSGFNAVFPTYAHSAQFTSPFIRLQDGPNRSPSSTFGGWLVSGSNTVFAGIGTFTVTPTTELGLFTYTVRVTGTGLNGTITKEISVPVRVVSGAVPISNFTLNSPVPNSLIINRPSSGTLASSSSVLANNFSGFNPSVPNSNLVNCTSRLSQLTASLIESPVGAVLPTPSPGVWSGGGGSGGLSSSCTSAMTFSVRSNTTPGVYTYRLSTIGTPPSGSPISKDTTQTVTVVPQGASDFLSVNPPRQTLVRPPAGSVLETMFNAIVTRVSGGYATTNYKPYTITSQSQQGITINPNYTYPDLHPSGGIEGPSHIYFQSGSTTEYSVLYETDLRGTVVWTLTKTGLGDDEITLIPNGSSVTLRFDREWRDAPLSGSITLRATAGGVSRLVNIPVEISPRGQQWNPIFVSVNSSVPTTTRIIDIRSTVNPALQSSFSLSILATSTTPTSTLPQCSDGVDNDDPEDSDADRADPGCHTDFNANNSASYDPNDNNERNTPSYTLRILPPKDITAPTPIPTSVSFPIRIQRLEGFTGSVQLLFQPSGGSLPTGVTYSFSPATLNSSQTNSTLTISAASNTILSVAQRQILFTVRGESSLTNEGSDSGSVTFAYSNDGCGCTYTSGVRFRDNSVSLGWTCTDIDVTDQVQLYRAYASYIAPPAITIFPTGSKIRESSLGFIGSWTSSIADTDPASNTNKTKSVQYRLECVQGNGTILPTANLNRDIIRKVFAPFGATILEQ